MDDLLADFLTETSESLSELDLAVVRLERTPNDQPTLSLIFRLVHTIKGTCGFLGLPRLERVAHASETVLDKLRTGSLTVTADGIGLILSAIDRIRLIVDTITRTEAEPPGDDLPLIAELNALAEGRSPAVPRPVSLAIIPVPTSTLALVGAPALPVPDAIAVAPPGPPDQGTDSGPMRGQTIRVSVDVLETLMTLVSELVLTRNQFLQQLRTRGDAELTGPVQRLSHLTTELQEGVMKTRMQPIGNVWNMLPRQVRDLAHDLGKRVDLVMHGAETELDRQVLELIKDPLTHMIRNSADHGLETPAERERAGKPPVGTITLTARHEGGHVVIEIEDDGRGIDVRRIAEKVIAQGMSTRAQIDAMSDAEIRRFIFQPGFSTAAAVTSVSGRGVGMDVVKTNIEQIGGMIELHSVFGQGSRFLIKIPLTLAIISALIVGVAGERFAIPQTSVVEVVLPRADSDTRIETVDGASVLRLRDRLLPLIRLGSLLQLQDAAQDATVPAMDMVAVIAVGSVRIGLIVDGVFDTKEIVVKPVSPVLRHIPLFGGNTILEDGAVIMILDPTGIARHAGLDTTKKSQIRHVPDDDHADVDRIDMLLVEAGIGAPKAIPLSLISRLESIETDRLEVSGGRVIVQYRGNLMPIITLDDTVDIVALALGTTGRAASHPVLVFDNDGKPAGLLVEKILDVVATDLQVEPGSQRLGFLGTAVIASRATDIVDAAFWLTRASGNWFRAAPSRNLRKPRLLVIDDSSFFRQLLAPTLAAAGYDVTVADSAERALEFREAGRSFEAIVSDIEMPGMGGLGFARTVRESGQWVDLPLLALSGSDLVQEARAAGFTDMIRKFERDELLTSLEQCLSRSIAA
ncbi:hybrid sensor histidine kinase/response regulator [Lichenicola cladoniae]|uniref:Chemotaxis protein CheA n=1 Tax=Lichenicola cladoniae TaxID=1484109 RepID=A0A6M8HMV4_9PROT|nr:hybrid sensor histidine kinase/response regulator [Lichenicola cladoniae]NPD67232.1 hybrid sensor histidine kinase/response regulator [Acetobacteraceae bacterium]QKE89743.1 hybrid sensor histidine kinase/response regulator [Lichenicola cladoniae]